jgi:hypothetical protein
VLFAFLIRFSAIYTLTVVAFAIGFWWSSGTRSAGVIHGILIYVMMFLVVFFLFFLFVFSLSFVVLVLFLNSVSFDLGRFGGVFLLMFIQIGFGLDGFFRGLLFVPVLFCVFS